MNYIVVDFEWNQSPYGKGTSKKYLPFEIIEIGAVKLDDHRQYLESFSAVIKPKVYKRLHYVTRELTGISNNELRNGEQFSHAIVDFMLWCGDEYMFCTWGNTDLIELQRNMKYYRLDDLLKGPIKYYNVQKLFRKLHTDDDTAVNSLEAVVEYFNIEKQDEFHRAICDAKYTAAIFAKMDMEKAKKLYTVDYFQNPKTKKDEIDLTYEDYNKHISREFATREEAIADRDLRKTKCYRCGKTAMKRIRWFAGKNRAYYCLAKCPLHGYIRGKIRLKKTDDDRFFAVKTLRLIDEEKAQAIYDLKKEIILKRKEKRCKDISHNC